MSDVETNSVQIAIAVMTEQINTIVGGVARIERIMSEQSQMLGEIPVIKRDVQELDEKIERAFRAIKALNEALNAQRDLQTAQKTTMRLVGALASIAAAGAIGLTGWCWTQLDGLKQADTSIAIRVNSLEVSKTEADKFAEKLQGFIRK